MIQLDARSFASAALFLIAASVEGGTLSEEVLRVVFVVLVIGEAGVGKLGEVRDNGAKETVGCDTTGSDAVGRAGEEEASIDSEEESGGI